MSVTIEEIQTRLKETRDRMGSWRQVGALFGVSGTWISAIARGEEEPGQDLRDRLERWTTNPTHPANVRMAQQEERERLAQWLRMTAGIVERGDLPGGSSRSPEAGYDRLNGDEPPPEEDGEGGGDDPGG